MSFPWNKTRWNDKFRGFKVLYNFTTTKICDHWLFNCRFSMYYLLWCSLSNDRALSILILNIKGISDVFLSNNVIVFLYFVLRNYTHDYIIYTFTIVFSTVIKNSSYVTSLVVLFVKRYLAIWDLPYLSY